MGMYRYLWVYIGIYVYIWVCVGLDGYIWVYMGIYGNVWYLGVWVYKYVIMSEYYYIMQQVSSGV